MKKPELLPHPRSLRLTGGNYTFAPEAGLAVEIRRTPRAPNNPDGYNLIITHGGVRIETRAVGGERAAFATLHQLRQQYGSKIPCLRIRDWPDFPRRGVMLDISRGRVPNLATLLDLVEQLASFKINEFQLYTEHTFAYRKYKPVWKNWGALTAAEIREEFDIGALADSQFASGGSADDPIGVAMQELQFSGSFNLDQMLKTWESRYIEAALRLSRGNVSQAAKLLGINRTTLYGRLGPDFKQ